ncbi:hypothetical protein [Reichenbachiella sp. MSK19-1]|uniref:hypothetical protein n=1 Tax=Reichenbachiella sp. MSK19-1 TaxID=1897631 RepID=UPI000E6BB169|nr:hypothetical protein [Reichenbachiella sp. MSK19-1]RJE71571.1 hypothetical protein BGP76_05615 [Reichenbachiella sp. MSK19-1]
MTATTDLDRKNQPAVWIILVTVVLAYTFFYVVNVSLDYTSCKLCDAHQYEKLYSYFETGRVSVINHPFYNRPLVPLLASLVPGDQMGLAFDLVNFLFFVGSIYMLVQLWTYLKIRPLYQYLGFGWLILHWTGIIRYNLYDNITVDVPLYFFQSMALLFFFQGKFKHFYWLIPLALLQKESFLAVMVLLTVVHFIFAERDDRWPEGKHLLLSLVLGIAIQKSLLALMPDQSDQRSSLMALLYHGRLVVDDPSRIIRWFAAFGSAFGLLPFVVLFRFRFSRLKNQQYGTLILLSLCYCAFGMLAGEDMTRILFLGFPFIMTLTLIELSRVSRWILGTGLLLSLVSLRLDHIAIDYRWAVDYANLEYIYGWASYYAVALVVFAVVYFWKEKKQDSVS